MYLLNPLPSLDNAPVELDLHSTMYLLNHHGDHAHAHVRADLHSTMYLLNPITAAIAAAINK